MPNQNKNIEPKIYCDDMDELVRCPSCKKILKFGDSYTSREVLTDVGFGYAVCPDCYEKELKHL